MLRGAEMELKSRDRKPRSMVGYPSSIVIALESEHEIIGTLNFASERSRAYSQEDVLIGYLLALQLAAALRNARRYNELQLLYRALDEEKGKADTM